MLWSGGGRQSSATPETSSYRQVFRVQKVEQKQRKPQPSVQSPESRAKAEKSRAKADKAASPPALYSEGGRQSSATTETTSYRQVFRVEKAEEATGKRSGFRKQSKAEEAHLQYVSTYHTHQF